MSKVSVIMASHLYPYTHGATKREEKFERAVDSFLLSFHSSKELIIIADGCAITERIVNEKYSNSHEIRIKAIDKQPPWSGNVRQAGLEMATGEIICYLDTDDYISPSHISVIENQMNEREYDWCYFNNHIYTHDGKIVIRGAILCHGGVGTSSIAHRKLHGVNWYGCDGYGHDWLFIQKLIKSSENKGQIQNTGYVICHTPNGVDF